MKVGLVTIGQSPRTDIVPELRQLVGAGVVFREAGALDGLAAPEVRELAPGAEEPVLVTRLADGTPVTVGERTIAARLQGKVDDLSTEVDLIALLCTGSFPELSSTKLILYPDRILRALGAAAASNRRVAVITPDPRQIDYQLRRWGEVTPHVQALCASPYDPDQVQPSALVQLGGRVFHSGCDLVVMDCLGYTLAMREALRSAAGKPVILARSVLARVIAELVC